MLNFKAKVSQIWWTSAVIIQTQKWLMWRRNCLWTRSPLQVWKQLNVEEVDAALARVQPGSNNCHWRKQAHLSNQRTWRLLHYQHCTLKLMTAQLVLNKLKRQQEDLKHLFRCQEHLRLITKHVRSYLKLLMCRSSLQLLHHLTVQRM